MRSHLLSAGMVALICLGLSVSAMAETSNGAARSDDECVDWWMETLELAYGWTVSHKGLRWSSEDGRVKLRFGGRIQGDHGWYNGEALKNDLGQELEQQGEYRRVRAYVSGSFDDILSFKFQLDFKGYGTAFKDVYIRLHKLPVVGNFEIGHFKEPFSMEELTSSKDITFIERALPNAMAPSRNWGMMFYDNIDGRASWALGVFKAWVHDSDRKFGRWGSSSQGHATALTGRVTWAPIFEDEGRRVLHVGASGSLRWAEEPVKWSSRPEAHFVKKFTSTGSMDAHEVRLMGFELAGIYGPFHAEAEYIATSIDGQNGYDDVWLHGVYVQAGYFLTGESRPYDPKSGAFKGVTPLNNFMTGCGPGLPLGAWEVAARYSRLCFDQDGLSSGSRDLQDLTIGLNWYLNPNVRMSWNYVRTWVDGNGVSDAGDMFLIRFQIAF